MENSNRDFKVLSDREHVLCRPGMYLGSTQLTEKEQWIFDKEQNKFKYSTVKIIPALLKCSSELIDNSIDVAIDTNFKYATKIIVNVDKKSISVTDNGIGIPCVPPMGINSKNPNDTCACLAWTKLKAGTSFDDNRKKIGTNGVGSSCVNVFSKKFIGKSDDGKFSQTIKCLNNMSEIKAFKVTKSSGSAGVSVYCEPDLERFGVTEIDQIHIDLIYQRLINLSICYPKIKFIFNKKSININNKKFAQMFSDNAILQSVDNATICIYPNEYDEFKQYSCVNGVDTIRGGSHVDFIVNEICSRVRNKLVKKYKTIRPGDIKNKICVSVLLTNFTNPKFDSQTKECLVNNNHDIIEHLNQNFDFDDIAKKILKSESIIDPIIETFKLKQQIKTKLQLKQINKNKVKIDASKYVPPIGNEYNYFCIAEGASASGGLSQALGRNGIGYYAGRGVPLNIWDCKISAMLKNKEFSDIVTILGIDPTKNDNKNLNFNKIILANDADCLDEHTKVITEKGDKELKDISFDDKLLTHNGDYKQVVNIIEKTNCNCIAINFNGSVIYASENHKFLVFRDGKVQEVLAKDLLPIDMFLKKKLI